MQTLKCITFNFILVFSILFSSSSEASAASKEALLNLWSLSPLHSDLRHPFEGADIVNDRGMNRLILRSWYEDVSVTKGSKPGAAIYCKIAHQLIYGRHKEREATKLPILTAFSQNSDLVAVELIFYALQLNLIPRSPITRRPLAPNAGLGTNQSALRVLWEREERVVPYLSISINRSQWRALEPILGTGKSLNFDQFYATRCERTLKTINTLRSNFSALETKPPESSNNQESDM